ncbi:MAG: TlpA family protein disulfide reductase [Propioniciclava sp.]
MTPGLGVIVAVVAVALILIIQRSLADGRARTVPDTRETRLGTDDLGRPLGTAATFVQFSAPVCGPCVATREVLATIAAERHGVQHVEISAAHRMDLVDRFAVTRTPTVLVLDPEGIPRQRLTGPTRAAEALRALATVTGLDPARATHENR